jgi:FK506-binding protein 1
MTLEGQKRAQLGHIHLFYALIYDTHSFQPNGEFSLSLISGLVSHYTAHYMSI